MAVDIESRFWFDGTQPEDGWTMPTKEELYERAQDLNIEGRSEMGKDELKKAIDEAEQQRAEQTSSEGRSLEGRTDVSQTAHNREREG